MRVVKIKSRYLKDLEYMYRDLGLVNNNQTDPSAVFVSEEDYKTMEREVLRRFKKEYPYLPKKKIQTSVAMHMFGLGPNTSLKKAIKKGFLLVDDERLKGGGEDE